MSQEILLEEVSPHGNLQVVVENIGGVVYMYLWGAPDTDFPTKSVWIRNIDPAPNSLDVVGMQEGTPPLNPVSACRHPQGMPAPRAEDLSVIWLPEGNGVGLFEDGELLAAIAPWSGLDGCNGYARDQIAEGPLAWELLPENELHPRFQQAKTYWDAWSEADFWVSVRDQLLEQVERTFGPHSNYYAIDGGEWPPKALVSIPIEEGTLLITIGVSLRPQPNVELSHQDPQPYRRIELGVLLPSTWSKEEVIKFAGNLSGDASYPWQSYTWFGPGHTISCHGWRNTDFDSALLVYDHPHLKRLSLKPVQGDPVQILWFLPISQEEQAQAVEQGSAALQQQLQANRWQES